MKNKTTLKITAFATTLIVSLVLVTMISNKGIFGYFGKETKFSDKAKVYNFLLADKARYKDYGYKSTQLRLKPRENAMKLLLKEREVLVKQLYNERLNTDNSDLPEDFKKAWLRFINSEKVLIDLLYSETKPKISESIHSEVLESEKEFRSVLQNYGFELADNLTVIDRENNFNDKVKIFNFLLAEKARTEEYGRRDKEWRMQTGEPKGERVPVWKVYHNERLNADTSGLPEDFKEAWQKLALAHKLAWDAMCSKVNPEEVKTIGEKIEPAQDKFNRVLAKYGFEIEFHGTIIIVDGEID